MSASVGFWQIWTSRLDNPVCDEHVMPVKFLNVDEEVKQQRRFCELTELRGKRRTDAASFPLTHTPELTGFQHNDQGSGERRWRTGSPDKALVSLPIQRPRSHISRLWGGDRTIRQTTWLLPLAKCYSAERKTRSRGRERSLPSHLFATLPLTMPYLSKSTHLSARQLKAIFNAAMKRDHS